MADGTSLSYITVDVKDANNNIMRNLDIVNMKNSIKGRKIYAPEIKPKMGMNKEEYRNNQDSTSIITVRSTVLSVPSCRTENSMLLSILWKVRILSPAPASTKAMLGTILSMFPTM